MTKSEINPQNDINRSVGGNISSTPPPNGGVNLIFDTISNYTFEKKQKETIALGLINKFDASVRNVTVRIINNKDNLCSYRIAAVNAPKFQMEQINNRYQEPINAEFYDADFYRAFVEMEIITPGEKDEEVIFYPFNVSVIISDGTIEGNINSILQAFSSDSAYSVYKVTKNKIRFVKNDDTIISEPISCSYLSSEKFNANFLGKIENVKSNVLILKEELLPNEAIGIWVQRIINSTNYNNNEEMLLNYKDKKIVEQTEEIELNISYNLAEDFNNYNEEQYEPESYS